MLRVSDETRERILHIGREEFGGAGAADRLRRHAPEITVAPDELADVRRILSQMLIV